MTTIATDTPDLRPEALDLLLSRPLVYVNNLEVIDAIILHAKANGLEVQVYDNTRVLNLDEAYAARYELGQDIR